MGTQPQVSGYGAEFFTPDHATRMYEIDINNFATANSSVFVMF
jgi:hypothetical protein